MTQNATMSHDRRRSSVALFLVACATVGAFAPARSLAAPQSAAASPSSVAPAAIQERLNRIGADLFAGASHAKEDIRELIAILAIDPSVSQAHLLLGVAYRALGSPDMLGEAKAEFRQALDLNPDLMPARFFIAQVYLELARPEKAREELNAGLQRMPAQPQFLALLGEAERQSGNAGRAVELSRQALQIDPTLPQARYYLGMALLDLGQREDGLRELEQVVKSGVRESFVFLALGSAYLESDRLDAAVTALEDAARIAPSMPDIRIQLARAYRLRGSLDHAEQQLTLARSVFPKQPTVALQRLQTSLDVEVGIVRLLQGRLASAATALQQAITTDPDSGAGHRYLAEVLLRQGLYSRALEHAVRAEQLGSPLPEAQRKAIDAKVRGKKAAGLQ